MTLIFFLFFLECEHSSIDRRCLTDCPSSPLTLIAVFPWFTLIPVWFALFHLVFSGLPWFTPVHLCKPWFTLVLPSLTRVPKAPGGENALSRVSEYLIRPHQGLSWSFQITQPCIFNLQVSHHTLQTQIHICTEVKHDADSQSLSRFMGTKIMEWCIRLVATPDSFNCMWILVCF